jgi:hypothetical protein
VSKYKYEIPYAVDRALDSVADQPGIRPVQVHRIALPLYVAEVSATVAAREPFDLLDRYVGLAIAECEFDSVAEISGYLGITPDVVDRVLRFLGEIGHLAGTDGAITMTDLGLRAARDETRYTPKEDRLKLYFDGVRCDPLPSRLYGRGVRTLDRETAVGQRRFRLLGHATGFRSDAIAALAVRPDRADYNLPDEHENLRLIGTIDEAFLPCYLIRAITSSGYQSLVFTAADSATSDPYLEEIFLHWPALNQAILTEDSSQTKLRAELSNWLDERNMSFTQLSLAGEAVPRLVLPASHFLAADAPVKAKSEFPLRQVGSYLTPHSFVLQLWCRSTKVRREAALQRSLEYADSSRRHEADITTFLKQLSERLEIDEELTITHLRAYARRTGRGAMSI